MCGIAGWQITNPTMVSAQGLWSLSRCLLSGIQSRGSDAAGYAYVKENGNTNFAKSPVAARDFLKIPGHLLYELPKEMPSNLLLHARYATQGEPTNNKNNHPLYSKTSGLCMVHNGWLMNDEDLKEQFSLKPDAEVDTEIYLRLIEKFYIEGDVKSIETAIKEATKCVYGAIACGMVQGGKHGVMWLWRDRGDLFAVQTEWGYVFASTKSILVNAIGCLSMRDLVSWKRFDIPPSTLVKFELGKKPKMSQLETIDWQGNRFANDVFTTTIDGEEKIRRVKRGSGRAITTYYYGNTTQKDFRDWNNFRGYHTNKGLYLPGVSTPEAGETDNTAEDKSDTTKPQRPQNHHIQCCCKTCLEWWEWQVANDNAGM